MLLQQVWIPPETVKEMAAAFARRDPEETIRGFEASGDAYRHYSPSDVADLQAFFRVCAERGLGLVGSW